MTRARLLAAAGLGAVLAGVGTVTALHVFPPMSRTGLLRRTISEFALHENARVFNLGVLLLAAGSLASPYRSASPTPNDRAPRWGNAPETPISRR